MEYNDDNNDANDNQIFCLASHGLACHGVMGGGLLRWFPVALLRFLVGDQST